VTRLLLAWRAGDDQALAELTPRVLQELQRIARGCMRGEPAGHALQATALVNEAYLRLIDAQHVNWQNRAHFLAMARRGSCAEFSSTSHAPNGRGNAAAA
jgi:hypothetical protein